MIGHNNNEFAKNSTNATITIKNEDMFKERMLQTM